MALSAGGKLGPYEIVAMIGRGGMGEVFRAQDTRLRRTVAIKVLPHDKLADTDRKRRFLQEARAASALIHPNIVVLHDIASDSGVDFLVMEYVPGQTLRERIKAGPLTATEVVRFGTQIASALSAAHAAGIIHRDIKPGNIMVTPDSQIKVFDFGLAKLAEPVEAGEETESMLWLTEPGVVVGTVAYMSPEQTRGGPLDARSDIFSLGSVLYEAATGRLPFRGSSTLAVMHEIASGDPAPPSKINSSLPPSFDQVIARAQRKTPNERYSSAAEMREALQALESQPVNPVEPVSPKNRKWGVIVAAALAILAAGAGAAYRLMVGRSHVPDPQALQLYQQGRRDIQEFTEHGFKQSIADFTNAIRRDPDYAPSYAGLADAYSYQAVSEIASPKEVIPLAESNAAKALERDPQLSEAYTSLGIVALGYYRDFPLAEQRFQRSLKINPRDAFTQHFLGHYYEAVGNWPEALNQMQRALDLEKLSPMYGEDLAFELIMNHRASDAVKQMRETVALAPEDNFAHVILAIALEQTGQTAESLDQAGQAVKLPGVEGIAGSISGVFCRLQQPARAREILIQLESMQREGKYVSPLELAGIQLALGNTTAGLAKLREAAAEPAANLVYVFGDPLFDSVRENPEFAALMNSIHLPRAAWHDVPRYLRH